MKMNAQELTDYFASIGDLPELTEDQIREARMEAETMWLEVKREVEAQKDDANG